MQRTAAHDLSREKAILGLVEFTLSFFVIDVLIQATATSAVIRTPPPGDIGFAALTIGLYRPEVGLTRTPWLIASGTAAIVVLAALLGVGELPHTGPIDGQSIYMAKSLAVCLTAMTLIRLVYGAGLTRTAVLAASCCSATNAHEPRAADFSGPHHPDDAIASPA